MKREVEKHAHCKQFEPTKNTHHTIRDKTLEQGTDLQKATESINNSYPRAVRTQFAI